MSGRMRCVWIVLMVILLPNLCQAAQAAPTDRPLSNPADEARAVALGNQLRCVVCQSETIEDSQADMAHDLRQLVRDKIRAGWSDQHILDYVRERYGDFILLRPPFQMNTWLLWFSPLLFFGLAAWLLRGFFEQKRKRKGDHR